MHQYLEAQIDRAEQEINGLTIKTAAEYEEVQYICDAMTEFLTPGEKTVISDGVAQRALRFRNHLQKLMNDYDGLRAVEHRAQLLNTIFAEN